MPTTFYRKSLFLFLIFWVTNDLWAEIGNPKENYHKYQVGLEAGIGDISAPGTRFPFGASLGGFMRVGHHTIGARRNYFTRFEIFQEATYYKTITAYYGITFEWQNTSISPQLGIGTFETNYQQETSYLGLSSEVSLDFVTHARGNGIGIRAFFNFNGHFNYVGISIHALAGWAWSKKAKL